MGTPFWARYGMGVEEVDMAVPVEASWRHPRNGPAAGRSAPLLAEELRDVLQARRRPTLTARQRARRERDLESACKRLAKRLASDLAGQTAERQLAETLRIRTYTEVLGMTTVLREAWSREASRTSALLRWNLGLAGGLLGVCVCAAWAAGWLPLA